MAEKGEGDPAPAVSLPLCPLLPHKDKQISAGLGQRAEQEWGGRRRGGNVPRQAGGREGS